MAPTLRRNRHHIDAAIDSGTEHVKRGVKGAVTHVAMAGINGGTGAAAHVSRSVCNKVFPVIRKLSLLSSTYKEPGKPGRTKQA